VSEGVREYKAGVASSIIMTGGAAHNQFTEANCMKRFAVEQGAPADAVIEEGQAKDTIQNIYFSSEIMQQHGWKSAEVVSSPSHLQRTALILKHYSFAWRTHAAHWPPEYDEAHIQRIYAGEAKYCWTLTHTGFRHSQWLPGS
jgi:vancomycin permeability regulator SanA